MDVCDRLAAKFTPLEVENIVDKRNKIKRFVILLKSPVSVFWE